MNFLRRIWCEWWRGHHDEEVVTLNNGFGAHKILRCRRCKRRL